MKFDFKMKGERNRFYRLGIWRGTNGIRNKVLERDNNECQWCKERGLVTTTELEVDHILELEHGTFQDAIDMDNLRTLCKSCHNLRHQRFEHGKFNFKPNKYNHDERWD